MVSSTTSILGLNALHNTNGWVVSQSPLPAIIFMLAMLGIFAGLCDLDRMAAGLIFSSIVLCIIKICLFPMW